MDEPSRKISTTDVAEKLSAPKSCTTDKKMEIVEGSVGD